MCVQCSAVLLNFPVQYQRRDGVGTARMFESSASVVWPLLPMKEFLLRELGRSNSVFYALPSRVLLRVPRAQTPCPSECCFVSLGSTRPAHLPALKSPQSVTFP
jgi:hypothetical protein